MPEPTINQLPRRRGVVMRTVDIMDSYGTTYQRQPSGALVRTSEKRRTPPAKMFDIDTVVKALQNEKHENQNLNEATA